MAGNRNTDEAQRLCPSCRMNVSVWATKCHHCGEELGRPRTEEAKLTLKDLGGGQKTTYAPSGNVTGALESFRVEETAAEASRVVRKPQGFWAGLLRKKVPLAEAPPSTRAEELPELDEYSRNLAASILDDMPSSSRSSTTTGGANASASPVPRQVFMAVGALVVVVVVYFVVSVTWSKISAFLEARNAVPVASYTNKAQEMLARGDNTIDAFEEAAKAFRIVGSEENQKILSDVRALLLSEVDELMRRNPWKSSNYDTAYAYMQRAVSVDTHTSLVAKFDEVNGHIDAYKFILKSIDYDAGQATFRLNKSGDSPPEVTVEVSDRMMDRFIIQAISSRSVDLMDEKFEGRKLTIGLNEAVKARR